MLTRKVILKPWKRENQPLISPLNSQNFENQCVRQLTRLKKWPSWNLYIRTQKVVISNLLMHQNININILFTTLFNLCNKRSKITWQLNPRNMKTFRLSITRSTLYRLNLLIYRCKFVVKHRLSLQGQNLILKVWNMLRRIWSKKIGLWRRLIRC